MKTAKELFERRKKRLRVKLRNNGNGYPRLSVFRSEKNISAQIIDDKNGTTLVSASSLERNLRTSKYADVKLATDVGKLIGERAVEKGVKVVVFDRGGYAYHGKVEALANGAREAGLKF